MVASWMSVARRSPSNSLAAKLRSPLRLTPTPDKPRGRDSTVWKRCSLLTLHARVRTTWLLAALPVLTTVVSAPHAGHFTGQRYRCGADLVTSDRNASDLTLVGAQPVLHSARIERPGAGAAQLGSEL